MESLINSQRARASELWRGGQYVAATRQFAAAARSGDEGAIIALLKALLALAQWDEAMALVKFWRQRLPASAPLAAYETLQLFAQGQRVNAGSSARALSETDPFSRAVSWAVQAAIEAGQHSEQISVQPSAPQAGQSLPHGAPWGHAIDSMQWLLPEAGVSWQAFPAAVLDRALRQAPGGGLCVECGVYWGRSIRQLAGQRDIVHGFDSFEGLPEAWKDGEPAGAYSTSGRLPQVPRNVLLYKGWFENTLEGFVSQQNLPLDLLHIDCDLYSSTMTVLNAMGPLIREGTVIVFDDYFGFEGWREHEHRALSEYCQLTGMTFRFDAAAMLGREVAIEVIRAPEENT